MRSLAIVALTTLAACVEATPPVAPTEPASPTAPVAVAEPAPAPRADPLAEGSPFAVGQAWRGDYLCAQGRTAVEIRITGGSVDKPTATFHFEHAASGSKGEYELAGTFDAETRHLAFAPGKWLSHPPNYVSVGLDGTVSPDGSSYTGRMLHPTCRDFHVTRARE